MPPTPPPRRPLRAARLRLAALLVLGAGAGGCLSAGPALQPRAVAAPVAPTPASAVQDGGATPASPSEAPAAARATGYFHKGLPWGTDAYAGPVGTLLNKGFAVAQWEGKSRHIWDYEYGWGSVWRSVSDPGPPVAFAGGWWQVIRQHALPFTAEEFREGNWIPNYVGHVVEGGIAFRRLREWNEARGVPMAGLVAGLTTYAAAVVNEAYETPPRAEYGNLDGTAGATMDLLLFDPLGIVLFSFDGPSRFFAGPLGAELWPTQASLVVNRGGMLVNNSHSLVLRPPLPFTDARLFVRMGMGMQGGVSLPYGDGYGINLGAGFESTQRFLDPNTSVESIEASWSAGVWIDRDDALILAATFDQATNRRVALNVFPGVVDVGGVAVGGWLVVDSEGRPFVGVAGSRTLGLGLGWGF